MQPGDVIDTLGEAASASLVPPGAPGASGFLEGIISWMVDGLGFHIGPLLISHGDQIVFQYGSPDDLAEDVDVPIEGSFGAGWAFVADSIEFVRPTTRFEAPMQVQDVMPAERLRPFGDEGRHSAQARDEDDVLAESVVEPISVEARAWIDPGGNLHATRVR